MEDKHRDLIKKIDYINKSTKDMNLMEVCGTHTHAIGKYGIRNLLRANINLISGPGCPVCVTPDIYIDYMYELSLKPNIIIATYGDMFRVPGSNKETTLEKAKALGAEVKIVYSSMDAVKMAVDNPNKKVVFTGIGFETTTPATAVAVLEADKNKVDNFYILSAHKIVEPVMRALLSDKELKIDGFIIPGHVAAVIGEEGFKFIEEYNCSGVITGFSMEEVVDGIFNLFNLVDNNKYKLTNSYKKLVKEQGNKVAIEMIQSVFQVKDDYWRGLGLIPNSGYKLKEEYSKFDIEKIYPISNINKPGNTLCKCGEVLKGKIKPNNCGLFGKVCIPESPVGPCMVSSEGSCAAFYKYNKGD